MRMVCVASVASRPATVHCSAVHSSYERLEGGETMQTYERPTLMAVGSFKQTGLGVRRGPERVLPLRFSL